VIKPCGVDVTTFSTSWHS